MFLKHVSGNHEKVIEVEEVTVLFSLFIGLDIVG